MNSPNAHMEDDLEMSHHDIHRRFGETPDGQKLAGQVRYKWFVPTGMSKQEWVATLGADVCNLEHNFLTRNLAEVFVDRSNQKRPGQFNVSQKRHLKGAGLVHDWGESGPLGDIKNDIKTKEQDEDEMKRLENESILWLRDVPAVFSHIRTSIQKVLLKEDPFLVDAFRRIEQIGYLRTGLNAWRASQETDNVEESERLQALAADVAGNQIPSLIDNVPVYGAVEWFLELRRREIEDMLRKLPPDPSVWTERYQIEQPPGVDDRLYVACTRWDSYGEQERAAA